MRSVEEQERAERMQTWLEEEEIERRVREEESKHNLELTKSILLFFVFFSFCSYFL